MKNPATLLTFLTLIFSGCKTAASSDVVSGNDAAVEVIETETVETTEETVEEALPECVEECEESVIEAEGVTEALESAPEAPKTIAEQFVAAGGQQLCEAMIFALNPDWQLTVCDRVRDPDQCKRRRAPLFRFAQTVCEANIAEALRWGMDPLVGLSDMEQESSLGRTYYDREAYVYRVDMEHICELFLNNERITCGLADKESCEHTSATRNNAVWACWLYGDEDNQNCQAVYVLETASNGVRVDTCVAGERGLFQLVPANWSEGTVVIATGEVLHGTTREREERLLRDPVLQVQLGYQELARHRDVAPAHRQADWTDWLPIYNIGKDCLAPGGGGCTEKLAEHWWVYLRNISRHYIRACSGWYISPEGTARRISDMWPECERVEAFYDNLNEND